MAEKVKKRKKVKKQRGLLGFLEDKEILVSPVVRKGKITNFPTKAQKARIKRIKAAQKKKAAQ